MLNAFFTGLFSGASLIIAIGAQNAFVLQQGLRKNYALTIASTCAVIDMILIISGSLGFGYLIEKSTFIKPIALYFGIIFLIYYAIRSFISAFKQQGLKAKGKTITSTKQAIMISAAFSLLNPHVYLDTVVLLGSISSAFTDLNKWLFTIGACLSSWIWFYILAKGASYSSKFFENPKSWLCLDISIGIIMILIAYKLSTLL